MWGGGIVLKRVFFNQNYKICSQKGIFFTKKCTFMSKLGPTNGTLLKNIWSCKSILIYMCMSFFHISACPLTMFDTMYSDVSYNTV